MLPLALKVVWFCLSFTGMIAIWVVFTLFSRAINTYWYPILYCVFTTMMQGTFCLGMIWEMDPHKMPRGFCVAQTFLIYYSAWSITGVCAAFTLATTTTMLWPSKIKLSAVSALGWSNKYYIPIVVFPIACLSVSAPVLLQVNAIQPTDDLHCDASHPEWGRFLGYAGFSMFVTLPCFFLSLAASWRVWRMDVENQRSGYSPRPHFSQENASRDVLGSLPHLDPEIPFTSQSNKSALAMRDVDAQSSHSDDNGDESSDLPSHSPKVPPRWTVTATIDDNMVDFDGRKRTMVLKTPCRIAPIRPKLAPAIYRMMFFQTSFFLIECLAATSTIIDVATQRPTPTPFGSQHIALVLAAWGPAIIFGNMPAVRRQLVFWRR